MIALIRRYPRAFLFSVLLHVGIIVLALLEFSDSPDKISVSKKASVDQTIKAEVIDQKQLDKRAEEINKQKLAEQKQKKQAKEKKRQAELKKKQQLAEKKKREEAKKKAAAEKKRKAEQAKKTKALAEKKKAEAEKKRLSEVKKQQEVERKKAEAERKRKADEKRKAEAERKRKLEEQRLKAEAEKKRIEEESRKAEQARLQAEAEQRRKEAELKAKLAAEERQRELDIKRNKYYALIKNKIERNWRQPVNAGNMPSCEVNVIQGPGGIILDVTFAYCPGTREYRLSVESAVLKSDPLPEPEDPALFDRNLAIKFEPKK